MPKSRNFVPYFLVFLFLSLITFGVSKTGVLKPFDAVSKEILSPFQAIFYGTYTKITGFFENSQIHKLQNENITLIKKLIDQKKLTSDNKALMDQFQTQSPKSQNLIPADIIGAPGFIPGISVPEILVIDRGETDGVRKGDAVVYRNNLIGKIMETSTYTSSISLITSANSSFTAKTLNSNSFGIVIGQGGGEMILDNVLLSDILQKDDIVLTKGDVSVQGLGFSPDLIVGKVVSVSRIPSDLFQKAEVKSLVDFTKLSRVFVISLK